MKIAIFISPHGFGHAARSVAIMEALWQLEPSCQFLILSKVPRWFFPSPPGEKLTYLEHLTDIGMVQSSPLHEDISGTCDALDNFLPFREDSLKELVDILKTFQADLVLADISPLGLVAASKAEIPSILIENFTWDWIYRGYQTTDLRLERHAQYFETIFAGASYHLQLEPVCRQVAADFTTNPVSRAVRKAREAIRAELQVPEAAPMVMLTMGGTVSALNFLEHCRHYSSVFFVLPGAGEKEEFSGNCRFLPHHSRFHHPDVVNASDAVIGKLGYSTVAEIFMAGVPYGFIPRVGFRESEVLEQFVRESIRSICIPEEMLQEGAWLKLLPDLLALPKRETVVENGAQQAARFIVRCLQEISAG